MEMMGLAQVPLRINISIVVTSNLILLWPHEAVCLYLGRTQAKHENIYVNLKLSVQITD